MEAFFLSSLLLTTLSINLAAPVIDNENMAVQYLMKYNYIHQDDMNNDNMMEQEVVKEGIKLFQKFSNVSVTGKFDEETMTKMNQPRCGMPDMMFHMGDARKRRFSAGRPWQNKDLTYRIDSVTSDFRTRQQTVQIMANAFKVWSDVSSLTFTEVFSGQDADIIITFAEYEHGDGSPFDGIGGVLAHAYYPDTVLDGDAHFDDSENFVATGGDTGTNLEWVAVHEFGHSLGLGHSDITDAVMFPYYSYKDGWSLDSDDIAGIQKLYGSETGKPDKPMPPVTMPPNMECTGKFDTITRTKDGSTYAFIGTMVYKLEGGNIAPGFPAKISDIFSGLPNDLDASVFWEDSGSTYIFKGDQYYRLTNTKIDSGYPRHISVLNGLPSDLDAAFVWSGNGRVYFIKGDEYYRYNRKTGRVENGYPRPLTVWPGLPYRIDSAMQWSNKRTYFFSEEQYYRFNDYLFTVDSSYPRSTVKYWVGCDRQRLQASDNSNDGSVIKAVPSLFSMLCSAVLGLNLFFNDIM